MNLSAILILMQLATSMLSALQANPNLPPAFRQEAFQVANRAIDFATQAIKENNQPVPQPQLTPAPTPEPAPSVIPSPQPTPQPTSMAQPFPTPQSVTPPPTPTTSTASYLTVDIVPNKKAFWNSSDIVVLTITTKLNTGEILPNTKVNIQDNSFKSYVSNSEGVIIYQAMPDGCGSPVTIKVFDKFRPIGSITIPFNELNTSKQGSSVCA